MKKIIAFLLTILVFFSFTILCGCKNDEIEKDPNAENPFGFTSNAVVCEVKLDGIMDDDIWTEPNAVKVEYGTVEATVVRRAEAIYFFFKVMDSTPYNYVSSGDATEVTKSDSVEFYFDSKLTRTSNPANNDFQVNLGRDGRTRICSGSGWITWMALYMFEVKEGTILDGDEDYYYVEAMIPVAQMGIGATEAVGIAFGQVDRNNESNIDITSYYTWTGLMNGTKLVDPQIPSTYMVLTATGNRLLTYAEYSAK